MREGDYEGKEDVKEFYLRNIKDLDVIKSTIQEYKAERGMPALDDSDFYEVEFDTKRLKIRKKGYRDILARIKEKGVLLDYFKEIS